AGRFLAVPGDERDGRSAVEEPDGGLDLVRADAELFGDALVDRGRHRGRHWFTVHIFGCSVRGHGLAGVNSCHPGPSPCPGSLIAPGARTRVGKGVGRLHRGGRPRSETELGPARWSGPDRGCSAVTAAFIAHGDEAE